MGSSIPICDIEIHAEFLKIQWNLVLAKGQGTDKIFARMRFVISRFFFIYFTVTEIKKIVPYSESFVIEIRCRVILLQIIMVSPGPHLVKNHESQSRTNESQ